MVNVNKQLDQLLDQFEPEVADAFRASMEDWREAMDLSAFIRALSNNDMSAAIASLHLDPAALTKFLDSIARAYRVAGQVTVAPWPKVKSPTTGARFKISFDARDPIAEAWVRQNSSTLITDITNTQRDAIQRMLEAGLAQGDNPTVTALDIVGRIGQNGKRQGGVIGLSGVQSEYLANAKYELKSDDSTLLRNYLNRELRDKRFDGSVYAAIDSGKPIDSETRTRMLTSYSNKMLKLRGDIIGRSETLPALHAAQEEAVRQAISQDVLSAQNVKKVWRSAHDARVRHSHRRMDGQTVKFDGTFVSPDTNARMKYPGDTTLGAPGRETIGCRCTAPVHVDFLAGVH